MDLLATVHKYSFELLAGIVKMEREVWWKLISKLKKRKIVLEF